MDEKAQAGVRPNTRIHHALRSEDGFRKPGTLELIAEEPFLIRVEERPYAVVMRTPGDELFHAAGFCLAEGIVDSPGDFHNIGYDEHSDPNVIDVWLEPQRCRKVQGVLRRRSYVSQTSCGVCGKQMIEDLYQKLAPAEDGFEIDSNVAFDCIRALSRHQQCYPRTRGSHAALVLDDHLSPVGFAEDVGRHNALDKATGKALMAGKLPKARVVVLSSRISHELVQKAARARLQIMVGHSRPTALAVELAKTLNMTLLFPDRGRGLVVVCGEHRIHTATANGGLTP
ncbi:MAG: formate dehydrogenase accessory sulfurtransferase FdhD [Candidatus Latescibacterota bacterium]